MFCSLSLSLSLRPEPERQTTFTFEGYQEVPQDRERKRKGEGERVPLCPADPIFQGTSLKSPVPYVECARTHRLRVYMTIVRFFSSFALSLSFSLPPPISAVVRGCNIDKCFAHKFPPFRPFFPLSFSSLLYRPDTHIWHIYAWTSPVLTTHLSARISRRGPTTCIRNLIAREF